MSTPTYTLAHWGTYRIEKRSGAAPTIHAFANDPVPSDIGQSMPGTLTDAVRIPQPMVRAGYLEDGPCSASRRGAEPFVAVDWDTATRMVAGALDRVRKEHGNNAVFGGSYGWSSAGRFHHAQSQLHRFLNLAGGYVRSVNTHSHAAAEVILPYVIGNTHGMIGQHTPWQLIEKHTDLFLAFGGLPEKNTQVSAGGVAQHSVRKWLDRCRVAGTEFVNISPLRSDIDPSLDARWFAVRPGSDTALMLGLAHSLDAEGLCDRAFLHTHVAGFERFRAYLQGETDGTPKTADWAAALCGIEAEEIRKLARRMASRRTMISVAWSLQRADRGEQPIWMGVTLAAMLGQIGLPGGGFGSGYGCSNRVGNPENGIAWPALPQFENPVRDLIPVARLADMLLNPNAPYSYSGKTLRYPEIRLVWWAGGNPFHHQQDLNKLLRAWRRPETVIVQDAWWTATARHADIVLPCTSPLERNDLGIARAEPYLVAMKPATVPFAQTRNDFEIFADIADHLGFRDAFTETRNEMDWVRHLYEKAREAAAAKFVALPDFETFWKAGQVRFTQDTTLQPFLGDFRDDPKTHPLPTPSGKIEVFSETIDRFGYGDCPGHPFWCAPEEWLGTPGRDPKTLHLISNQPATRLHSQLDNGTVSRASKIAGREPASFNPQDATARGITAGAVVRLYNARGACLVGARLSEDVAPGIVQLSTGAWFNPSTPGQDGALDLHGNPNVLTRDAGTSQLAQGPIANSALVFAEPLIEQPPPVTAFAPPDILANPS